MDRSARQCQKLPKPALPARQRAMTELKLAHGLTFAALYQREGLIKLDGVFVDRLAGADADLHNKLMAARREPEALAKKDESALLIALARHVEDFLADLFGVAAQAA